MNRIVLFTALIGVTAVLPLEAQQGRKQTDSRVQAQARRPVDRGHTDEDGWKGDDRNRGRSVRDDDNRTVRHFIDRNGLECEERAVTKKNGQRSYDLKCREPKNRNRQADKGPQRGDQDNWPTRDRDENRFCIDANRDGRCDAGTGRGYPTTLPDMIGGLVYGQGQRTLDVTRWLGAGSYQARYTDVNRDRRPERVRWLDGKGTLVQEWLDNDRDGRADLVNVFSAGRLVQSIGGR
jgi:hypothetical protein